MHRMLLFGLPLAVLLGLGLNGQPEASHSKAPGRSAKGNGYPNYGFSIPLAPGVSLRIDNQYLQEGEIVDQSKAIVCQFTCNGGKHAKHDVCEPSCDTRCEARHSYSNFDYIVPLRDNDSFMKEVEKGLAGAKEMEGELLPWDHVADRFLPSLDFARNLGRTHTWYYEPVFLFHWAKHACAADLKYPLMERYGIHMNWELSCGGKLYANGSLKIGTLFTFRGKFQDGPTQVNCACKHPTTVSHLGTILDSPIKGFDAPMTPGSYSLGEEFAFLDFESGAEFEFPGMGTGTYVADENDKFTRMVISAGALFQPSDPTVQKTVALKSTTITRLQLWASLNGAGEDAIESACAEIAKKEPRLGIRFKIVPNPDYPLVRLAEFAGKQRFRGPWDQARTWIYTDAASLDEINKVMVPKLQPGAYLRMMYDVSRLTNVDLSQDRWKACWDPKLLTSLSSEPAVNWFVKEMSQSRDEALAGFVAERPEAFAPLFRDPDFAPDARAVGRALTMSASARVRAAGLKWMARAVPEGFRKAFMEEGGLLPAHIALAEKDPALVDAALDVFEAYEFPGRKFLKDSLDPSMPEAIKQRALRIFGSGSVLSGEPPRNGSVRE